MEQAKIIVKTSMAQKDYKKFIYIATFKRNKYIIPMLGGLSLLGASVTSFTNGQFSLIRLGISWIILLILSIGIVIYNIERKNKKRVKENKTGDIISTSSLWFYEDRVVLENSQLSTKQELEYNNFYRVMETKDYFILYWTEKQASLIRKQDVGDLEKLKQLIRTSFKEKYRRI